MKLDAAATKKLTTMLAKISKKYESEAPASLSPIDTLVHSFLSWEATVSQADVARERLYEQLTSINELRVSYNFELIAIIGEDYPMAEERIIRLKQTLNEVYNREHAVEMKSIASKPKKEQKYYLDTLPGAPSYVMARTFLLAYGGHAVPVDRRLIYLMAEEMKMDPESGSVSDFEAVLLKNVRAADAKRTYLAMQAWSEAEGKLPPPLPDHNVVLAEAETEGEAAKTPAKKKKK